MTDSGVAAEEAFDLGVFGAGAFLGGGDGGVGVDLLDEGLGEVSDGDFGLGGDVDFLADGVIGFGDGEEAADGVFDEDEVAGGC